MRVKILEIHRWDAYWGMRDKIIGREGTFETSRADRDGWTGGVFTYDEPLYYENTPVLSSFFFGIKYEILGDKPKQKNLFSKLRKWWSL